MKLSDEMANKVWDVLVEMGGAEEAKRFGFISYVTVEREHHEYRFMGKLGGGGKFHTDDYRDHPIYVTYYPEQQDDERDEIEQKLNAKLSELWGLKD